MILLDCTVLDKLANSIREKIFCKNIIFNWQLFYGIPQKLLIIFIDFQLYTVNVANFDITFYLVKQNIKG